MSRVSALRSPAARERRGGNFRDEIPAAVEKVRILLVAHLPHGSKATVAARAGISQTRLSEQLNGENALSALVVAAALPLLPRAVSSAVLAVLAGGEIEYETLTATIVRFKGGQVFLPGF